VDTSLPDTNSTNGESSSLIEGDIDMREAQSATDIEELAMKREKILKRLRDSLFFGRIQSVVVQTDNLENVNQAIQTITLIDNNLNFYGKQSFRLAIRAGECLEKYKELCSAEKRNYLSFLRKNKIKWGKTRVDDLIRVYNFSKLYPKISHTSESVSFIVKNLVHIRAAISSNEDEKIFWKSL
jgi:hypothetical protein